MPVQRLLVIGLDGLEPSLVQAMIDQGRLPNLARLREQARWGPLRSTLPYATFPAWTSFMTGVNPGEHGIFDFARRVPGTYDVQFVGAHARRRPIVPTLASAAGLRTACIGFPGTYPPEPIDGVMIGGFDSPVAVSADASFIHPPELADAIERRFGPWVFADFAETGTALPGWHRRAARKLLTGLRRRRAIAAWLLDREDWDLFMVHFGESDTAAHHFWAFHDPRSPRRPADLDPDLVPVLSNIYAELDHSVGLLAERLGPDGHLLIASDHGFGGSSDKVFYLNRWLAQQGWLAFHPTPGAGQRAFGAALRAGLAVVPGRLQQRLWRLAGPWAGRAEARRRYSGIDWARTRAYSDELSYNPTIRLNLAGRDPLGLLPPEDADALCDTIAEALTRLRDPWTDRPVLKEVWRREALYHGPALADSPELVLDLALDGDYAYNLLTSGGPGPLWRTLAEAEKLGAKGAGMNGTHRRDGFWLVHGPAAAPRRKRADMVDMAPTMLAALGMAPLDGMEGRTLLQPPGGCVVPRLHTEPLAAPAPYTAAQQAIVEDRLRRLGYL